MKEIEVDGSPVFLREAMAAKPDERQSEILRAEIGPPVDPTDIVAEEEGRIQGGMLKATQKDGMIPGKKNNIEKDPLFKQMTSQTIRMNMPMLVQKALELAEGIYFEQEYVNKAGKKLKRIYKRAPDLAAIKYLLDRELGSPVQQSKRTETKEVKVLAVHIDQRTHERK